MKQIHSNLIGFLALAIIISLYNLPSSSSPDYWEFLTHPLVLNIVIATVATIIGIKVKNYALILIGATLVLAIYICTFAFDPQNSVMNQFFLAIYTIFLAFSLLANTGNLFKEWLLSEK
jgi:uncharacterized membrane protein